MEFYARMEQEKADRLEAQAELDAPGTASASSHDEQLLASATKGDEDITKAEVLTAAFRARVAEEGTACPRKAAKPLPWPQRTRQELHDKHHLQHPTPLDDAPQ